MKSFRSYLLESPIDDELRDKIQSKIDKGKAITIKELISIIKRYSKKAYPKLAKDIKSLGRWRIPLLVPVLTDKFEKHDRKKLGYKNNHVPTVMKIAEDADGCKMNKTEYDIWNDVKNNKEWSRWLCPVFDDTELSLFTNLTPQKNGYKLIQMPYCQKTNLIEELHDWFCLSVYSIKDFFDDVADQNEETFDLDKMIPEIQEKNPYFKPNTKQKRNLESICRLIMNYRITDLHGNNFGILNGQMVILDYGDAEWFKGM